MTVGFLRGATASAGGAGGDGGAASDDGGGAGDAADGGTTPADDAPCTVSLRSVAEKKEPPPRPPREMGTSAYRKNDPPVVERWGS